MGEIFSFGEWVRRRRKALDLTQDALARQVGCALSMVRKIEAVETGRGDVPAQTVLIQSIKRSQ